MLVLISTAGLYELPNKTNVSQTVRLCSRFHATVPSKDLNVAAWTVVFLNKESLLLQCLSVLSHRLTSYTDWRTWNKCSALPSVTLTENKENTKKL